MTLNELHKLLNEQYSNLLEHKDQGKPIGADYLLDTLMTSGEALNQVPEFKGGTYFKLLTELAETQMEEPSVDTHLLMNLLRSALQFIEQHYKTEINH